MLNTENILKLADIVEQSSDFDMSRFRNDCGTPACIAGYACSLYRKQSAEEALPVKTRDLIQDANAYLGITSRDIEDELYCPGEIWDKTREDAVKVLRNLAETGEVDWNDS